MAQDAPLASRASGLPHSSHVPPAFRRGPAYEKMDLRQQEVATIEDLLYVLLGAEGRYIRFQEELEPSNDTQRLDGPKYKIANGLDPSLRDLAWQLLRLATQICSCMAFVEIFGRPVYGSVSHALVAAVRHILTDYILVVAEEEHRFRYHPRFTLHMLHLQLLQTGTRIGNMHALIDDIVQTNRALVLKNHGDFDDDDDDGVEEVLGLRTSRLPRLCKGGAILELISRRIERNAGDQTAKELYCSLLRDSSRPYMRTLNKWLHEGLVADAHDEFLVREQVGISKADLAEDYTDEYWDKRFTLRDTDIPIQLQGSKEKILLAGKYLNVVRECGGKLQPPAQVVEEIDADGLLDAINAAYAHANRSLLQLIYANNLSQRLLSLKRYLLLDHADYLLHFLDVAGHELRKPVKSVSLNKLQSLLDLVLRHPGSSIANDAYKEDVSVQMNEISLTDWLMRIVSVNAEESLPEEEKREDDKPISGLSALQLDYHVPFPLSLVISRKTILRYQLLFRHLLALQNVERQLGAAWIEHVKASGWLRRSEPRVEEWKGRAWTLRARMLAFTHELLYFCTSEVIEPNFARLQQTLGTVETVDALMQLHVDFLDTCLKECMLTNGGLLRVHAKLLHTCTMFASYTGHLSRSLSSVVVLQDPNGSSGIEEERMSKLEDVLGRYETNFSRQMRVLLDSLNYFAATETVALLGIYARLTATMGWQV